ncbi:MAG: hypothetical protein ACKOEQ_12380 [Verrucomicrobiota bacterium]
MKRRWFLSLWLMLPVALAAYHFGPGRAALGRDHGAARLEAARRAEAAEDWQGAMAAYDAALAALPSDATEARARIRLAQARARVFTGELPEAMGDMEALLADVKGHAGLARLEGAVREELASAQYHAAWLMRLEGADREEWTAQTEKARQNFRLLAEHASATADARVGDHQRNLEATVRLAQMDLSELQGLPLPKKCSGCKNCSQKCRAQRESQQRPEPKEPKDARGSQQAERPAAGGS